MSVVDLPGGGAGRSLADVRRLDAAAKPSGIAAGLFGVRRLLGRVFGWDRVRIRAQDSLQARLSERDRRESEVLPGTFDGPFLVVYQFRDEALWAAAYGALARVTPPRS